MGICKFNAGGNAAMDCSIPSSGGVSKYSQSLHAAETKVNCPPDGRGLYADLKGPTL